MYYAKHWHIPSFNRPWLLIPVPAEWKREGDVTTVIRYQKFITNIYGMHSLENLPLPMFEAMRDFDIEEAEAERLAIEAAQQGDE